MMINSQTFEKCSLPDFYVNSIKTKDEIEGSSEKTNWSHDLLGIPHIWRKTNGRSTKVAILDTGIELDHDDLKGSVIDHKDFTGDGIDDVNGHGTHCAGIVGARLNGSGFVGIAPECKLIIGKVLGNNGSGSCADIARGVDWAVAVGADIISMSLGGPGSTKELFTSIHRALAKGVTIVCAAGNSGSIFSNTIGYPGRYGGVITIASHDRNGNRSGFSSRGGEIDFMAPGQDILSTYIGNKYASLSGTSMATPFVAGICALLHSSASIANCEDMRDKLMKMAAHPGCHDNVSGYGPLNPFQYFY